MVRTHPNTSPGAIPTPPGPQNPPETSKTKEKHTQNKVKTFFSGPLFAYRVPLKGPFGGEEIWCPGPIPTPPGPQNPSETKEKRTQTN